MLFFELQPETEGRDISEGSPVDAMLMALHDMNIPFGVKIRFPSEGLIRTLIAWYGENLRGIITRPPNEGYTADEIVAAYTEYHRLFIASRFPQLWLGHEIANEPNHSGRSLDEWLEQWRQAKSRLTKAVGTKWISPGCSPGWNVEAWYDAFEQDDTFDFAGRHVYVQGSPTIYPAMLMPSRREIIVTEFADTSLVAEGYYQDDAPDLRFDRLVSLVQQFYIRGVAKYALFLLWSSNPRWAGFIYPVGKLQRLLQVSEGTPMPAPNYTYETMRRFSRWQSDCIDALERGQSSDDPRDLEAFKRHLTTTGGDPSNLYQYGVPSSSSSSPSKLNKHAHLILTAGHHNTGGGNELEYVFTGLLCQALSREGRDAGFAVTVVTPDEGLGRTNGGIAEVAKQVVAASGGKPLEFFIEAHTNAGPRGLFVIYPDWLSADDTDVDLRENLGAELSESISRHTAVPIWNSGVMSERSTHVGSQGIRLGMFGGTVAIKATCTRMLIEYGAHTDAADLAIMRHPDFATNAARGTIEALAAFVSRQVDQP